MLNAFLIMLIVAAICEGPIPSSPARREAHPSSPSSRRFRVSAGSPRLPSRPQADPSRAAPGRPRFFTRPQFRFVPSRPQPLLVGDCPDWPPVARVLQSSPAPRSHSLVAVPPALAGLAPSCTRRNC